MWLQCVGQTEGHHPVTGEIQQLLNAQCEMLPKFFIFLLPCRCSSKQYKVTALHKFSLEIRYIVDEKLRWNTCKAVLTILKTLSFMLLSNMFYVTHTLVVLL